MDFFFSQGFLEFLDYFEEDDDLIGSPAGDIGGVGLEVCASALIEVVPFRG